MRVSGLYHPLRQAIGIVAIATALGEAIRFSSSTNIAMVYLLAVVVAAFFLGRSVAVLASLIGVIAFDFFFVPPHFSFAVRDTQFIFTFIVLAAVGLLIGHLASRVRAQAEAARDAEILRATDRLQKALLDSISHDLRTPLVTITGALSSLYDKRILFDDATRLAVVENALAEAERLNRLVGNLLDMTRIEAGAMRLAKQPYSVQELVGTALDHMADRLGDRKIELDVPDSLPLVPVDPVLMDQVLLNLLDNTLKYSSNDTPIAISAKTFDDHVAISISDQGVGIDPEDLPHVFDKFYRVRRPGNVAGTGLGLSVCKGFVEAHGGQIQANNRPCGGVTVTLTLPLGPQLATTAELLPVEATRQPVEVYRADGRK